MSPSADEKFTLVVRYVGYMGWWWHIENRRGEVVSFVGEPITDMKKPDGVALRGRAWTKWGAKRRGKLQLQEVRHKIPPPGGWKKQVERIA